MKIIIVGAFHEFIELAEEAGHEIVGLIDNVKKEEYFGYPIICSDSEIDIHLENTKYLPLVISPDKPEVRKNFISFIGQKALVLLSL